MSLDNLYFTLSPKLNLQNSLWLASIHPLRRDFFFPAALKRNRNSAVCWQSEWECEPWGTEGREGVRRLCQWTSEIRDTGARTGKRMVIPAFRDSGTIVGFFIVGAKVLKLLSRICGVILLLLSSMTANAAAGGQGGWWTHSVSAQFPI